MSVCSHTRYWSITGYHRPCRTTFNPNIADVVDLQGVVVFPELLDLGIVILTVDI